MRVLAVFMVVLAHTRSILPKEAYADFFRSGQAGVDLFFVISGFIMVYVTTHKKPSLGRFVGDRLTRIVPLYWVLTLAVFGLALAAPHLFRTTTADPLALLQSLLFVPFVKNGGYVTPLLYVGWSLNYEMFFYGLFALGLWAGRRGAFLVMLALAAVAALHPVAETPVARFYTDPLILEFAGGMAIGLLWAGRVRTGAMALLALGLALLLASPLWTDQHRLLIWGVPSMFIVAAAVTAKRQITSRPLLLLGAASYSIYLTHPFVTLGVAKASAGFDLDPLERMLVVGLTLLLCCTVGMAVHLLLERPLAGAAGWLRCFFGERWRKAWARRAGAQIPSG